VTDRLPIVAPEGPHHLVTSLDVIKAVHEAKGNNMLISHTVACTIASWWQSPSTRDGGYAFARLASTGSLEGEEADQLLDAIYDLIQSTEPSPRDRVQLTELARYLEAVTRP